MARLGRFYQLLLLLVSQVLAQFLQQLNGSTNIGSISPFQASVDQTSDNPSKQWSRSLYRRYDRRSGFFGGPRLHSKPSDFIDRKFVDKWLKDLEPSSFWNKMAGWEKDYFIEWFASESYRHYHTGRGIRYEVEFYHGEFKDVMRRMPSFQKDDFIRDWWQGRKIRDAHWNRAFRDEDWRDLISPETYKRLSEWIKRLPKRNPGFGPLQPAFDLEYHGTRPLLSRPPTEVSELGDWPAVSGDVVEDAELGMKRVVDWLGTDVASNVAEDAGAAIGIKAGARIFYDTGMAIEKLGARVIAKQAGKIILELARRPAAMIFLVLDIEQIVTSFIDIAEDLKCYDMGTCSVSDNVCHIGDAKYKCQESYTCLRDGATCAYGHHHPAKVVCDWDEFSTWLSARQLQPHDAFFRVFKASWHRKLWRRSDKHIRAAMARYYECMAEYHHDESCRHLTNGLKTWFKKHNHHAARMNWMVSQKFARCAAHAWVKAASISEHYSAADKELRTLKNQMNATANASTPGYSVSTYDKANYDKANAQAKSIYKKLVKTIKKARRLSFKADPVGMTALLTDHLASSLNATVNGTLPANGSALYNMTWNMPEHMPEHLQQGKALNSCSEFHWVFYAKHHNDSKHHWKDHSKHRWKNHSKHHSKHKSEYQFRPVRLF